MRIQASSEPFGRRGALAAAGLLVPASLLAIPGAAAAEVDGYEGRAVGLSVSGSAADVTVSDTGPGRGARATRGRCTSTTTSSRPTFCWPPPSAPTGASRARPPPPTRGFGLLDTVRGDVGPWPRVGCLPGADAGSEIARLSLAGEPIEVTGEPNQTVRIPGIATLVIDEQDHEDERASVDALLLRLDTGPEVVVSHAAGVSCSAEPSQPHDLVTGGGYGYVDRGRSNLGVVAGYKPNVGRSPAT